jgi:hypothetical protein
MFFSPRFHVVSCGEALALTVTFIGLEREQWIQTNPLRSSRDSHAHVLLNAIVVQRWAIVSTPIHEFLFWSFG